MNLPGYYSSGQFARMANVSIRTIRFYDKQNILIVTYLQETRYLFFLNADKRSDCVHGQVAKRIANVRFTRAVQKNTFLPSKANKRNETAY